jgi:hypothetical protein
MPKGKVWSNEELFLIRALRPCLNSSEITEVLRILGYSRTHDGISNKSQRLGVYFSGLAYPETQRLRKSQREAIDQVIQRRRVQEAPIISNPIYKPPIYKAERLKASELISELNEMRKEMNIPSAFKTPLPIVREGMSLGALVSDVHMGRRLDDEAGNMIYNMNIARKRLIKYANEIVAAIKYNKAIKELVLCVIGDIADGLDIFPNQNEFLESAPFYQTKASVEVLWEMILIIKNYFPDLPIRIVTTRGNHGRIKSSQVTNWDAIVYQMLEILVDQSHKDIPSNIRVYNSFKRPYQNIEIQGWKYHLRHVAPVQADTNAKKGQFASWYGIHHWDAFCYAHFHHYGIMSWNGKPILRNGSVIGADDYSEELACYDNPNQLIFGVTEKSTACFFEPINLLDN